MLNFAVPCPVAVIVVVEAVMEGALDPSTAGATATEYVTDEPTTDVTVTGVICVPLSRLAENRPKPISGKPFASMVAVICVTAARLMRPPPRDIGFVNGALLELLPTGLLALFTSADLTCSGDQFGCNCLINAADPATWGVAMLVPWKKAKQGD